MSVYDVKLLDDDTGRVYPCRLQADNSRKAEAMAYDLIKPEHVDADGCTVLVHLRPVSTQKLPKHEADEWLSLRGDGGSPAPLTEKVKQPVQSKPTRKPLKNPGLHTRNELLGVALSKLERGEAVGTIQQDTEWTYQNLNVAWNKIDYATVPSPGAVALLEQAKGDKKWFLEKYHARLLPTKAQIDAGEWREADDNQVAEMAARLRDEMLVEEVDV